ncbi:MAG: hypothetical protein ACREFR_17430 [Limisphaerales bacterium]
MKQKPPDPIYVTLMHKAEEISTRKAKDPGRKSGMPYRITGDSTGINPGRLGPIVPAMSFTSAA